ncbi:MULTISPECIES: GLPGLI family protein [Empedobacter]|uniref:GLPGLI family protein n=2 Tax=Weeksellaceae TaxID=2762318 RepID=UPI001C5A3450|nr:GLPGLI family protein [Empedobacter sp.]MBW1619125.1 GLPGLI family protein [Empedobacter falsenii]MDM1138579.1 GLPGLI family protein [Empedobacter sp. R132-2]
MNKNIIVAITSFLGINLSAQTQKESIRATYKAEFIFDYEQSKDMFSKNLQPAFKMAIDRGVFVDFILESNKNLSVFRADTKVNNAQHEADMVVQEILKSEQNPLYKDFSKNEYYKQFDINVKTYLVKENIPNFNWKLTKEKAVINGYNVVKAIDQDRDGNEFTAWYSPEIRYKDGPYYFSNLPGLILQAEIISPYFTVIFKINQLEILKENLKINLPTRGKVMTLREMQNDMNAS